MSQLSHDSQTDYSMTLFTLEELDAMWPNVEDMLTRIPHTWGHMTIEEIRNFVFNGLYELWGIGPKPSATFVLMTMVGVYPSKRILMVTWGAGRFKKEMLPLLDATLTQYAQIQNCDAIEIHGRGGWERVLRGIGFKVSRTVLGREVPKGRLQ